MRAVILLALGLAAMAMAGPMTEDFGNWDVKQRQVMVLKLLNHVLEPVMYKEIEEYGKNFKIEENIQLYSKSEVVKKFIGMVKGGMLPRGEVFTLHVDRQLKEVVTMFHMLYFAKDFATFMKTACWMRLYLNEGMFVYAFTIAVRHREDCKGIIIPPPYEIYPYYFVRADVIQKAYLLKMKKGLLDMKLCEFYGIKKSDKGVYIIDENVFDQRVYISEEDKLRYFTEDIDLNTYYYYFHVDYPFWMKEQHMDKLKFRRYELTLYMYQQILARYYLERLSNGMGEIPDFAWGRTIQHGYWPWMKLHNGVEFPPRYNNFVVAHSYNYNTIRLAEDYEAIIREAIIKGFVEINGLRLELNKYEDIETLGKLIYGKVDKVEMDHTLVDSYRYLLIVMKAAIGLNTFKSSDYFVVPSVLDQYQTALRDPVFYQLQKRLASLVYLYKLRLPCYSKEELYFPGVKIDNVSVDKLITYFDDYLMDMSNAVYLSEEELKKTHSDMTFFVRKRRLNHQPFKISLEVLSDKAVDCVVRVFLGPKKDYKGQVLDINSNRINFVELDSFLYKLSTGKNTIVRNSYDMHNLVPDRMSTHDFWKKAESISDIRDLFVKDFKNYHTGFPTRLMLPRGRVGGFEMMLYFIVSPLKMVENVDFAILDTTRKDFTVDFRSTVLLDKMPLGFPLDRPIDEEYFFTPNMKFVDVMIFHKAQTCEMRARWNRWVLKNYSMVDSSPAFSDSYFVDTDFNTKFDQTNRLVDM